MNGLVLFITARARCKLRHKHAHVWIRWFDNKLPPGVKKGEYVTIIGKLFTFNNGKEFQVLDAVLLKTSPRRILKEIRKVLPELIEFPNPEDFAKAEPR